MERRYLELRSEVTGDTLTGHAAVFGEEAQVRDFWETVTDTFFDRPLAEQRALADAGRDTVFQVDHGGMPLGRTGSGTLRLAKDTRGLHFELALPDTSAGRDVRVLNERGDLRHMSFGFAAARDAWTARKAGGQLRSLIEAKYLFDISVVTHPSYAGASAGLRSWSGDLPELPTPMTARDQYALIRARARIER